MQRLVLCCPVMVGVPDALPFLACVDVSVALASLAFVLGAVSVVALGVL